jgi:hypothetical protein
VSWPNYTGALIFINAEAALVGRLKTACRPTRVDCLHWVPDNHLLDMLGHSNVRKSEWAGPGSIRDSHHPALTLRAAGPLDGKHGWVGMTIGFGHVMLPLSWAGSATLAVTGRCRYGTVMDPACSSGSRSPWSILLTSEKLNERESHTHRTTHSGRRAHRRTS